MEIFNYFGTTLASLAGGFGTALQPVNIAMLLVGVVLSPWLSLARTACGASP